MNRIFIDMDGVIVDFDGYARKLNQTGDETKRQLALPAHGTDAGRG